jgi:hypothetical protein
VEAGYWRDEKTIPLQPQVSSLQPDAAGLSITGKVDVTTSWRLEQWQK